MDIENLYVVTGEINGKIVFLSIDRSSGGYPYWSSFFKSAETKSTLKEAEEFIKSNEDFLKNDYSFVSIEKIEFISVKNVEYKAREI